MQRASFADMECPIARATEEVGEGWSLLILRNAFLGARTFQEFEERLGIVASTLTRRLAALCERGLLVRRQYQSKPARDEYLLSEKGLDLLPVLMALAAWGNRWLAPGGAWIVPVDLESGAPIEPILVDRRTARPLRAGDVGLVAGPGASKELRRALAAPVALGIAPAQTARTLASKEASQ
jgi:DNA-binding HxlR family transcriptional regulator